MSVLKGKRAYLSGPIEFSDNLDWRIEPKRVLAEEFGLDIHDPFDDPKQSKSDELLEARKNKDLKKIREIAKAFVRKDLSEVDASKLLIAYLPAGVRTTGAIHEIIVSNENKCPTLLVCPQGAEMIPFWLFGFIGTEFMFSSWEELYKYLREVNDGKHVDSDRWTFVYGLI